jgi:hypothetical protein
MNIRSHVARKDKQMNLNNVVVSPPNDAVYDIVHQQYLDVESDESKKLKIFNRLMETLDHLYDKWGEGEDSRPFKALSQDCDNHTNFTHWLDAWAVNYVVDTYKEYKEITNV